MPRQSRVSMWRLDALLQEPRPHPPLASQVVRRAEQIDVEGVVDVLIERNIERYMLACHDTS